MTIHTASPTRYLAALLAWTLALGCGSTTDDGTADDDTGIVINEVQSKSSGTVNADWIELFNAGDSDTDIGNWTLNDSRDREPFVFAAGTILEAGAYQVVDLDETGEMGFTFGLGDEDAVRLFNSEGQLVDSTEWSEDAAFEDESWGRYPNGSGEFKRLVTATKGHDNADTCGNGTRDAAEDCDGDDLGDNDCTSFFFVSGSLKCTDCRFDLSSCVTVKTEVVINEVVAKATDGATDLPDWVELYNGAASEVDLTGWTIADENGSNVYTFAEGSTMAASAYLVVDSTALGLGLGAEDTVKLFDRASVSVDETSWIAGQAPDGTSWGRVVDGTGSFQTLDTPTRGTANQP